MTRWTDQQQKVINTRNRNILVSAAAGSGKTAVLVERIITMITDEKNKTDIDKLLVVTFTKAAAAEMKERISKGIAEKLKEDPGSEHLKRQEVLLPTADIVTIDSFCLKVVKEHFNIIGIDPALTIGDSTELALMQSDVMNDLLEEYYEKADEDFVNFTEYLAKGKTDFGLEDTIIRIFNMSRSAPDENAWLHRMTELYRLEDEELEQRICAYIKAEIDIYGGILKGLCDKADKYISMDSRLNKLKERVDVMRRAVAELLECNTLEELFAYPDRCILPEFRGLRKPAEDPEAYVEALYYIDKARTIVKKEIIEKYLLYDRDKCINDIKASSKPLTVLVDIVKRFGEVFKAYKDKKNIVDFSDVEHFALDILTVKKPDGTYERSETGKLMSSRYIEILCDEYQDTNALQEEIIKAVSTEKDGSPNIFMVGDVKQSIYKFRMAKPELFMEKYDSYKKDDASYCKIILDRNFRSRDYVLESINEIFRDIMHKDLGGIDYDEDAALVPGLEFGREQPERNRKSTVMLLLNDNKEYDDHSSLELEALMLGAKINEITDPENGMKIWDNDLKAERTVKFKDIVILLRNLKGISDVYQTIFNGMGIPVYTETKTGFFKSYEVTVMTALLSIMDNMHQDVHMAAVMRSFIGGFTDDELALLKSSADNKHKDYYECCRQYAKEHEDMLAEKTGAFLSEMEELRRKEKYMSLPDFLRNLYEETDFYDMVSAMPNGMRRSKNLDLLSELAIRFEQGSYNGLFNFLRYIEKYKEEMDMGEAGAASEKDNTVKIMTIHKSKGLEFPVVFVSNIGKQFNNMDARNNILIHESIGFGLSAIDIETRRKRNTILMKLAANAIKRDNLSEELRILYVAMTRAREKLYLTSYVDDSGKDSKMNKWEEQPIGNEGLDYYDIFKASNALNWIMPVIQNGRCRYFEVDPCTPEEAAADEAAMKQEAAEMLTEMNIKQAEIKDSGLFRHLESIYTWEYPFLGAAKINSKVSVSDIKKKSWEDEDGEPVVYETRSVLTSSKEDEEKPESTVQTVNTGAALGTAYHKVFESIDYDQHIAEEYVKQLINELLEKQLIDEASAGLISRRKILAFVRSDVGCRMREAHKKGRLKREQQFVIGIPARSLREEYDSDETVLMQGIIDAFFEEDGGIVLLDYKTDRVDNDEELIKRYKTQMVLYKKAIEQLLEKPVKECIIYSVSMSKEVKVDQ